MGYLDRVSKVLDEIVRGVFVVSIVFSVEVFDLLWVMLENVKESFCGLFFREFERVVGDGDGMKVIRFFKFFFLIGRVDVGFDVYG